MAYLINSAFFIKTLRNAKMALSEVAITFWHFLEVAIMANFRGCHQISFPENWRMNPDYFVGLWMTHEHSRFSDSLQNLKLLPLIKEKWSEHYIQYVENVHIVLAAHIKLLKMSELRMAICLKLKINLYKTWDFKDHLTASLIPSRAWMIISIMQTPLFC